MRRLPLALFTLAGVAGCRAPLGSMDAAVYDLAGVGTGPIAIDVTAGTAQAPVTPDGNGVWVLPTGAPTPFTFTAQLPVAATYDLAITSSDGTGLWAVGLGQPPTQMLPAGSATLRATLTPLAGAPDATAIVLLTDEADPTIYGRLPLQLHAR